MYGTCGRIDNKADFDFDFDNLHLHLMFIMYVDMNMYVDHLSLCSSIFSLSSHPDQPSE